MAIHEHAPVQFPPRFAKRLIDREDKIIQDALEILSRRLKVKGAVLGSPAAVRDFLRLALGAEQRELFMLVYLDAQNAVIDSEVLFAGTISQTAVYTREVVKAELSHNASCIVVAHNHPSGVAEPSHADRTMTNALTSALAVVEIKVIDHFVVAGDSIVSFVELGLL